MEKASRTMALLSVFTVAIVRATSAGALQWQIESPPPNSRHFADIAIDPQDENTWYLGTMEGTFITRNGGASWAAAAQPGRYTRIVFDPLIANRMYVAAGNDLWRSDDHLDSVTKVFSSNGYIRSFLVSARDGKIVIATQISSGDQGIYVSHDSGATWEFRSYGLSRAGYLPWDIAEDPCDGTLYVAMEISDHPQPYRPPFLRSRDGGRTWEDKSSGALKWHVIAIQINPDTRAVYALTEGAGLYRSDDFGESWVKLNTDFGRQLLMDMRDPRRIFGGETTFGGRPGGVFLSTDTAETFTPGGLSGKHIAGLRLSKSGTQLFAVEYGESPGLYRTTLPLMEPALQSPRRGVVLDNGCLDRSDNLEWQFHWSTVAGATKYQLVVKRRGSSFALIDAVVTSSSYEYSQRSYITDQNRIGWTWKVRAGDESGAWSPWSEERSFEVEYVGVDCGVLRPPVPMIPASGAQLDNGCSDRSNPLEWEFRWSEVAAAAKYELYVKQANATAPVIDIVVTSPSFRRSTRDYIVDQNRTDWRWKVRAGNAAAGWSPWSQERRFDVEHLGSDCGID